MGLTGTPRPNLVAIFNAGSKERPNFRIVKPDMVPIDKSGHIIWFADEAWRQSPILPLDRIVLEKGMFGGPANRNVSFPGCSPQKGAKVTSAYGITWLMTCPNSISQNIERRSGGLAYDPVSSEVRSSQYSYKFKTDNQMLFQSIAIKGKPDQVLATDSDLYIKADIKNFFTLNFQSTDIESKIISKRIEPSVALASLGFYLKVLFFKIVLDLTTDVSFFENSANIPMIMTLPIDASKRLNRRSGVLYSFKLGDGLDTKSIAAGMPLLIPSFLDGDFVGDGLKFCASECAYNLRIPMKNKSALMEIILPREVVELGMFPWFVDDVAAISEQMDWNIPSHVNLKNRIGIYFEVSKLPEGSYPWDFWISF